jgi:hypothetical protein
MCRIVLQVVAVSLIVATSARADAVSDQGSQDDADAGEAAADETLKRDAARTARAYTLMPFAVSPRVGDQAVTGHFWGGYDGGARGAVGEAIVDGRVSRSLALRAGATSSDLWGRSTAILGARVGILREGAAPLDLGVGVVYQPQSIRGDGIVTATVALGKTVGRLSAQGSFGYGQDPEADDGLGVTSVGAVFRASERVHLGIDGRARVQLWSTDKKFASLEQPIMDFTAGPLLAYAVGPFDLIAYGGLAGLMRKAPPELVGARTGLQLGPLVMLGVGAAL